VDAPSVLVRRLTGDPLVVLAAIFQHSPSMLMSVRGSGIGMPHDLVGKRVMFDPAFDVEVSAMIAAEGMKPDAVEVVPHSWSVEDLASGRVDAMSAYITSEPYLLRRMGLAPLVMRPLDYGVDFYGDCLVTTERRVREDPEGVESFLRAVRRGWAHAMSHPGEMVDLIHAKYAPDIPKEQLLFEAEAMRELVRPDLVEIGHMNPERWRQMARTYARLGMVSGKADLSGFIYSELKDEVRAGKERLVRISVAVLLAFVCAGSFVAGTLFLFNARLGRKVREQTAALSSSERSFRAFFEMAGLGVAQIDGATGSFCKVNEKFQALMGCTERHDLAGPGPPR
jgi:ABC-type nitrate/sulfonate/bicarbonate transport system substrate-binding protein